MSSSRSLLRATSAIALIAASTTAGLTATGNIPVVSAMQQYPIALVDIDVGEPLAGFAMSPNNAFGVARNIDGARFRFDLATGTSTAVTLDNASINNAGTHLFGTVSDKPARQTITTGVIEEFTIPYTTDWAPGFIHSADSSGRYLLINTTNGNLAKSRSFLYDSIANSLVTPDPVGLSSDNENSLGIAISPDGNLITYAEFFTAGAVWTRFTEWNRATNQQRVVNQPAEHKPFEGNWDASADLEWILFPASATDIESIPGDETRLYRREVATGTTLPVPVSFNEVASYSVHDGGRVVLAVGADAVRQLHVWDGIESEVTPISIGTDGSPADFPIDISNFGGLETNADATSIVFASFATNLVEGISGVDRRVYKVRLPSLTPSTFSLPTAAGAARLADTRSGLGGNKLAPSEKRCLTTVNTNPGDYIGINITPVHATNTGFGTIHSSDSTAGTTSNVNFTPGSVDPNFAIVQVGTDKQICFTNSQTASVNIIIDQLINAG